LEPFPWESESCLLDGFGLVAFRLRLRRRSLLNAVESMFCHGLKQLTIAPPQVSLPLAVQAHSGLFLFLMNSPRRMPCNKLCSRILKNARVQTTFVLILPYETSGRNKAQ
jgi:hypothetical protein